MASYMNRTTLKATIRNALADYVEWAMSKGFKNIDEAADQIVALLPGEIPKEVGKLIVSGIHLGVKLNYPISKLGELIAKKIREGGRREERYSGVNNDVGLKGKVDVPQNKPNDIKSHKIIVEKEGENIMAKKVKKSLGTNGGGGARSRKGQTSNLNPYQENNAKVWGRNGTGYKTKRDMFGSNDLSWVSNYPELLKGIIGPNFFRKKGLIETPIKEYAPSTIGSVASIELLLTNGHTEGQGYNLAIDKLYASLRSANTGSIPYTKQDLQHYMWNARMILALIRYGKRAYGVLRKYALTDKAVPQAYFKAMGLDFDTFAASAADLRQELNYLSTRLHTTMPYKDDTMERTCWLFDHIFADSDDAKAQKYLFCLNPRMQYWNQSTTAWTAIAGITNYANSTSNTGIQLNSFLNNIKSIVNVSTTADVFSAIAADMLKCFGIETTSYYTLIDENYETSIVYNEEVLTEIQNATLIGEVVHSSTAVQSGDVIIDESTGYIVTDIINPIDTNVGIDEMKKEFNYLNTYKDKLNNAEVVTFARLQATGIIDSTYSNKINWNCRGTETATIIRYIYIDPAVTYKYNLDYVIAHKFMAQVFSNATSIAYFFRIITLWSQFDWSPMLGWGGVSYGDPLSPSVTEKLGYLWDFNDYALVDSQMLESYHDIAIMSQYNAPLYIRDVRLNAIA